MNTHPIKQHYVPQFYLKKFSLDKKTFYRLDKESNEILKDIPIKTVAQKKRFYDVTLKKNQINEIFFKEYLEKDNICIQKKDDIIITLEYWFSKQEAFISNRYNYIIPDIYNTTILDKNYIPSNEIKTILCSLCSLLLNRGIQSQNLFNNKIYEEKNLNIYKDYIYPMPNEYLSSFNNKLKKLLWFTTFMNNIEPIQFILFKKIFQILSIDPSATNTLCTSDNPIVFYRPNYFHPSLGISTLYTQIFFSLSPHKLLRITNPNEYGIIPVTLKDKDIAFINQLYYQQSKKYVFSRDYNNLLSLKKS